MSDLRIITSGELDVAAIVGETPAGIEFVDAWAPPGGVDMTVVDAGRIVIAGAHVAEAVEDAKTSGLSVEVEAGL